MELALRITLSPRLGLGLAGSFQSSHMRGRLLWVPQLKYSQQEPQAAFPYHRLSYNMPDNYYLTVIREERSIIVRDSRGLMQKTLGI